MRKLSNAARVDLERRIVSGLIRFMKRRGFAPVRVNDGDAIVPCAKSEKKAMEAVFSVDEASLRFAPIDKFRYRKPEDFEHGVLLVLGNGIDVISDWNYTDGDADGFSAAMNAYCDEEVNAIEAELS